MIRPKGADGVGLEAARRELERLRRFSTRLSELKGRGRAIESTEDLHAVQDANLAAFEAMTDDVGVAAHARMMVLVEEMRVVLENADDAEVVERFAPRMQAAADELDALRDRESEKLLDRIAAMFEAGAPPKPSE